MPELEVGIGVCLTNGQLRVDDCRVKYVFVLYCVWDHGCIHRSTMTACTHVLWKELCTWIDGPPEASCMCMYVLITHLHHLLCIPVTSCIN